MLPCSLFSGCEPVPSSSATTMAASSAAAALGFCALLLEILLLRPSPATAQPATTLASDACTDFSAGTRYPGSAWTLDDCVEVWRRFRHSVPPGLQRRLPDVDLWGDTGLELRRAGSPCLVASKPTLDGAGSSTIRHLATWIYSEQMGCDWVTPDWGKQHVGQGNGTEVMYCHRTATSQELDKSKPRSELQAVRRCSVIDWLSYFQFNVRSVELPKGATLEYIEVRAVAGSGVCHRVPTSSGPARTRAVDVENTKTPPMMEARHKQACPLSTPTNSESERNGCDYI